MKLTQVFSIAAATQAILVGIPEITAIETSDGEPYFVAKLKTPITVRCSVDKGIEPFEADEVYLRQSALDLDWTEVTAGKPEDGYYMPGWVVDFSKGQEIPIYQSETIQKWTKGNRVDKEETRRSGINAKIRARREARKAAGN